MYLLYAMRNNKHSSSTAATATERLNWLPTFIYAVKLDKKNFVDISTFLSSSLHWDGIWFNYGN